MSSTYKLLIVEDEINSRNGLLGLIKSSSLSFAIETAIDGLEGYNRAVAMLPDIIITDIQMPLCSGLDMIKKLREAGITSKYIILTGYAEFKYAREALQYGVTDYILKPIVPDQLFSLLKKCISLLKPAAAEFIHDRKRILLLSNEDTASLAAMCKSQKFNSCIYAVLYLPKADPVSERLKEEIHINRSIFEIVLPDSRFLGILIGAIDKNPEKELRLMHYYLRNYPSVVCIYNCILLPQQHIGLQAFEALSNNLYWNISLGKSIFPASDATDRQWLQLPQQESYHKNLKKLVINHQYRECSDLIIKHMKALQKDIYHPREIILSVIQSLYKLEDSSDGLNTLNSELNYMNTINQLMNALTMNELLDIIRQYYCFKAKDAKTELPYSKAVVLAIAEIKNNYSLPINLNTTAEKIGITPQHLSRIFMKETNKTFIDYLTQIRMQKAQYLLKNSGDKIQNIAIKTGYPDSKYFCTIFKKETGITPTQFRSL